jgi:hypothetical protein
VSEEETPAELEEKRKDYRNVVRVQLGLLLLALVGPDVLPGGPRGPGWYFYLGLSLAYMYLLWDLLRHLTRKAWIPRVVGIWMISIFVLGLTVNEVFKVQGETFAAWNIFIHCAILAVEFLVMRMALVDLFTGTRTSADKIWASAAIYFMLGLAFANIFRMLHLGNPAAYGVAVNVDYTGYYEALNFSFSSLVGLDNAFPNSSHLFRNMRLLEGVLGQLYLVLLISRVLLTEEKPAGR